ncbi:Os01g0344340 [Oryza sativa Japonica Group]|uniref:Uncharacterized protein n=3 Tax=Oryza sativa TaxID=4530 RepID=A0A8J8Y5C2_ORYSJ|nr:hypothetical protein OsI_01798 [Oryza sativa Indica Group]EEE54511.1 hypothetical protein OsJ_01654 [Oryza sativa Japonica Group]KAF2950009.1 hypothetical protein DAI22_01g160200 [Oryza sativa Japonica Group]BAS71994.1 Os01g0344340 [Oryza sativa Japonica Group]
MEAEPFDEVTPQSPSPVSPVASSCKSCTISSSPRTALGPTSAFTIGIASSHLLLHHRHRYIPSSDAQRLWKLPLQYCGWRLSDDMQLCRTGATKRLRFSWVQWAEA